MEGGGGSVVLPLAHGAYSKVSIQGEEAGMAAPYDVTRGARVRLVVLVVVAAGAFLAFGASGADCQGMPLVAPFGSVFFPLPDCWFFERFATD